MNIKIHDLIEAEYKKLLIEKLRKFEGIKYESYSDDHGIPTIGVGFALIIKLKANIFRFSTKIFNEFKNLGINLSSYEKDQVKNILNKIVYYLNNNSNVEDVVKKDFTKKCLLKMPKSFKLNDKQIAKMLDKKIDEAENLVKNRGINLGFSRERLILVDLVFNSPELLGKNLSKAVKNGDRLRAWYEIRYKSNGDQSVGIAKRRYEESEMFNCFSGNN